MTYAGIKSMIYCGVSKDDERIKKAYEWDSAQLLGRWESGHARHARQVGPVLLLPPGDGQMPRHARHRLRPSMPRSKHDWAQGHHRGGSPSGSGPDGGSSTMAAANWMEADENLVTGYALDGAELLQAQVTLSSFNEASARRTSGILRTRTNGENKRGELRPTLMFEQPHIEPPPFPDAQLLPARARGGSRVAARCAQPKRPRSRRPGPHLLVPPTAKNVIFLFMGGGPSHVDTFDPKPMLTRCHGEQMPASILGTHAARHADDAQPGPFQDRGDAVSAFARSAGRGTT